MKPATTPFPATRQPTRAEITDRAAREIITAQRTAQRQQIARLRAARMKKEAAERSLQNVTGIAAQDQQAR